MSIPSLDRSPSWRPQGADLYPTGAATAIPAARVSGSSAPAPVESMDRLGEGATVREPDKPSSAPETPNRDWTETKKQETVKEPEEPPKEPISKMLLEFIQSMWRASGSAVEMAQEMNKTAQQERQAQQEQQKENPPLTYADPKVKRTSGL